jgi:hypothetical protein
VWSAMPFAPNGRIGDSDPSDFSVGDNPIRSSSDEFERKANSTIDEAISTTILRDVKKIGSKMKHVMMPHSNPVVELRDWDLWGPLFLCMLLASSLCYNSPPDQVAVVFTSVFFIIWVGAGVITLNGLLLGGRISFFQSVCVLGMSGSSRYEFSLAPISHYVRMYINPLLAPHRLLRMSTECGFSLVSRAIPHQFFVGRPFRRGSAVPSVVHARSSWLHGPDAAPGQEGPGRVPHPAILPVPRMDDTRTIENIQYLGRGAPSSDHAHAIYDMSR